jgi:hypothetical protein
MFWKMALAVSTAWLILPAAVWILAGQIMRILSLPPAQNLKTNQLFDGSRIAG